MPRKVFKNDQEKLEYWLERLFKNDSGHSAAALKIQSIMLLEWAAQKKLKILRIKVEELEDQIGLEPEKQEPERTEAESKSAETKPFSNFLDEVKGRK